jgi:hypothetical protein
MLGEGQCRSLSSRRFLRCARASSLLVRAVQSAACAALTQSARPGARRLRCVQSYGRLHCMAILRRHSRALLGTVAARRWATQSIGRAVTLRTLSQGVPLATVVAERFEGISNSAPTDLPQQARQPQA